MSDIPALMNANLFEVFNQRDAGLRRTAVERTYAHDVRWTDAEGAVDGRAALDVKAAALQATLGPLQFVAAGPARHVPGLGFLAWHLVAPGDETPKASGFDVAIIRDDVIAELYTVLT
ncbi:nuclear transport factor 2 family protein [Mycobacterium sp. NPDC003449]